MEFSCVWRGFKRKDVFQNIILKKAGSTYCSGPASVRTLLNVHAVVCLQSTGAEIGHLFKILLKASQINILSWNSAQQFDRDGT